MPTYNYHCSECGFEFESHQKIAERDLPTQEGCPTCSGKIERGITSCAVVSQVGSPLKAPDGFKSVLKEIKKNAGKRSTIDV